MVYRVYRVVVVYRVYQEEGRGTLRRGLLASLREAEKPLRRDFLSSPPFVSFCSFCLFLSVLSLPRLLAVSLGPVTRVLSDLSVFLR